MSLLASDNAAHYVNHGSASSIDRFWTGSLCLWYYPLDITESYRGLASKVGSGWPAGWTLYRPSAGGSSGQLRFDWERGTTYLQIHSAAGTFSANKWQFIGITWKSDGANADQKMFVGDLVTPATEVSYASQQVGTGTIGDDENGSLYVLNDKNLLSSMNARVAFFSYYNTQLTLADFRLQQYSLHRPIRDCGLFCNYGLQGLGIQPDLSGKNNHGVVTGATLAPHLPRRPKTIPYFTKKSRLWKTRTRAGMG